MLRAIREISPRWVVGENVRGLTNWNGGVVFDEVQTDLEAAGYEVTPFLLPACAVNAPHRRDRIWFVADTNGNGLNQRNGEHEVNAGEGGEYAFGDIKPIHFKQSITKHPNRIRRERWMHTDKPKTTTWKQFSQRDALCNEPTKWQNFPTQSPICNGDDGLSDQLDGITFSKWRNESIKAGGNAVVPQVVYQIFKAIGNYELLTAPATDTRQSL